MSIASGRDETPAESYPRQKARTRSFQLGRPRSFACSPGSPRIKEACGSSTLLPKYLKLCSSTPRIWPAAIWICPTPSAPDASGCAR
jgi:hypothetical protein